METSARSQTLALYRRLLRELPTSAAAGKHLRSSNPIRAGIRARFHQPISNPEYALARRQEAEQAVQYLKAQRIYGVLLARYNPGAEMEEEERVRLTARRVGMDMPEEWYGKGEAGKFGISFEKGKKK